jgi:predicted RNase H-like nuclease (RuvC/YqgF family)
MDNRTSLEKLSDQVTHILQSNSSLKEEVGALRTELMTLKAEKELTKTEMDRLVEENLKKDIEIEEIVNKIETILG